MLGFESVKFLVAAKLCSLAIIPHICSKDSDVSVSVLWVFFLVFFFFWFV